MCGTGMVRKISDAIPFNQYKSHLEHMHHILPVTLADDGVTRIESYANNLNFGKLSFRILG
jgi:hypothetical protein